MRRVRVVGIGLLALAALLPGAQAAKPALGASFTVNSTVDAVDTAPGDGVCADGSGQCTLRAAIQETNALPGADAITLPPGTYTLKRAGCCEDGARVGDLDITDDLSIAGAGTEETAITEEVGLGGVERVFDVREFAVAAISALTIRDVDMHAILPFEESCGAGIRNFGDLTAFRLVIRDNVFRRGGGGACNFGTLRLSDSLIEGNCACLIGPGGGVFNARGGFAILERLTISSNRGDTTGGGGIANYGSMILRDSTVTGNTTDGDALGAGGIDNAKGETGVADGTLAIVNSTISGNHSDGSLAGGLSNHDHGNVTIINSTVTANGSNRGKGGISTREGSTTTLINTIVAGNEDSNCDLLEGWFVAPASGGHNLEGDGSCQLSGPGDLSGVDPMLGELADNGGPTLTHALLPGSPAIDAGDDAQCPAADQRGAPRPGGANCDIGAYEAGSEVPEPPELIQGDADCDGAVTAFDALKTLRFVAGLPFERDSGCPEIGEPYGDHPFGDVNCDDSVDTADALWILRFLAALPVKQNEGCTEIGKGLSY